MRRTIVSLFALAFVVLAPLAAQTDQTGVLEGIVRDDNGNPIISAQVSLAQADGAYPRATESDALGAFRVGFLTPGLYDVSVRAVGYRPTTLTSVRVRAGQVSSLEVVQPAATVQIEALTVTADMSLIDATTSEFSTTLDDEAIEILPISRTAVNLIQFTPGARPDQVFGGSTQQANIYQLDGVGVNDPGFGGDFLLPNPDWIDEITVKGLGAGAEYGGFQGGVVNIVTKSGTNTTTGTLRFNYSDHRLNASNLQNACEAGSEFDNRWEINGSLSGPVIRDKLYYFVSAAHAPIDTRVVDLLDADGCEDAAPDPSFLDIREEQREFKALVKLTWQATENDILNVAWGKDDFFTDNAGVNSFDDPETVTKQESPAWFGNFSWQRVWSSNHLTELKVTGWNGRNDFLPLNGDDQSVILLGGFSEAYRNANFLRQRDPDNVAFTFNLDSYVTTGNVRHHFKIGAEHKIGLNHEQRDRTGVITWRPEDDDGVFDPNDPATWDFISSDWGGRINLQSTSLNTSFYVQDYLTLSSRVSLSAGVRLSNFVGRIEPGDGSGEKFTAAKDFAIAPRIGATVALIPDGTVVGKAHWGRYFQDMFGLMYDRVEGGNVFTDVEYWDWIGPGLPELDRVYTEAERDQLFDFFGGVPLGLEVGPVENYKQPFVDQFIAGLEWEFAPGWKAEALYVNRRNKNIIALVDKNLETNYTLFTDVEVFEFPSGDPVLDQRQQPVVLPELWISNDDILFVGDAPGLTPAEIAALTWEEDLALTVAPEATRKLDQVQLSVERTFDRWAMRGSIVWSDLRGNFFSVSGYENPFGTGVGAFVHPNEQTNFFGDLQSASDWEAKLQLTVALPAGLRAGAFVTYFTGEHYTPTFTIDRRNHDYVVDGATFLDPDLIFGIDGETIFLEDRGSRTRDNRFDIDLHVGWVFALQRVQWEVGVDVFNLTNSKAVTSLKTSVNEQDLSDPNTVFGAPRFRVQPRNIRVYSTIRFF